MTSSGGSTSFDGQYVLCLCPVSLCVSLRLPVSLCVADTEYRGGTGTYLPL